MMTFIALALAAVIIAGIVLIPLCMGSFAGRLAQHITEPSRRRH